MATQKAPNPRATRSPEPGNMIGLFLSEVILFAVVAIAGLVLGWRVQAHAVAERIRVLNADIDGLRTAWSDAQVRRARTP